MNGSERSCELRAAELRPMVVALRARQLGVWPPQVAAGAPRTPHRALSTQHSALRTPNSTPTPRQRATCTLILACTSVTKVAPLAGCPRLRILDLGGCLPLQDALLLGKCPSLFVTGFVNTSFQ